MKNLSKILKIVALVISLIAVYYFYQVSSIKGALDGGTPEEEVALQSAVGGFVTFTKWLLILVGVIIAAFVVLDIVKHPKNIIRTLIGLGIFVVLYFVSTMMAGSEEVMSADYKVLAEEGSDLSKYVSTGIILSAILGIIAFGGFIFDSLKSLFK